MQGEQLARLGDELGLDVVGAAPAEPYDETERHIRERRARGLFADMRFTMARPGGLVPSGDAARRGAHGRLGRALLLARRASEPPPGHGRLPRYTWCDAYAVLRERLDELGRAARWRLPRARRREPARRPRGGRALRGRLLRQEHDADHAAPRLVGRARDARHRRRARGDAAARRRLRLVHALHRRLPDRRARRAGRARRDALPLVLDAGGRPDARARIREALGDRSTAATSARTSARGTAASSGAGRGSRMPEPSRTSRSSTGSRPTTHELAAPLRPPVRPAQRPALPAPERPRRARQHRRPTPSLAEPFAEGDDPLLREHAEWALERLR